MKDVNTKANEMKEIFEKYANQLDKLNNKGLKAMGEFFETVPVDIRGDVFVEYMNLLNEGGYEYEVEQFGATLHSWPETVH